MKRLAKYLVLAVLAVLASMALSACGDSPAAPANTATLPTRTVSQATSTVVVAVPTGTTMVAGNPTSGSLGDTGNVTYKTYTGKTGNWSIDYPSTWTVNETGPTTQFLGPKQETFSQVTYSDVGGKLDTATLVKIASDNLKASFGDSYVESKQEKQADGSTRIDFTFNQGTQKYAGYAFVEQRGTGLYLLMLIANPTDAAKYDPIFSHIVSTYVLPADTANAATTPAATTGAATGAATDLTYKTYAGKTGNWSIDYPSNWTVSETGPTTQFLGPNQEAFSQVTYTDIGGVLDPDTLVNTASTSLKTSFGDSYNETERVKQPDGSTRLNFTFEQSGNKFNGEAFVEERGMALYMLMNISTPAVSQQYSPVFQHIVQSYKVPKS